VLIEDTFLSLGTQMLPNLYTSTVLKDFFKVLHVHIKAPKWHLKGPL